VSSHKSRPQYLVGIDLGTSHTVVAYCPIDQSADIYLFTIEQFVRPGEIEALDELPSVRYHAASAEMNESEVYLPGFKRTGESKLVLYGQVARFLGSKSQGRLITSAKSWLSHPTADRTAAILPWGKVPDDVIKVSPVEASRSYLAYIREAWNHHFPQAPLEEQSVVVTIPASFDEMSRVLTLEASALAKLPKPRLLEEPQAAFYDWLWQHRDVSQALLKSVRLLLIIDIGGGTTDLTLIQVTETASSEPQLTRIAVGSHLMLGGDNIDLALAHMLEPRLIKGDAKLSASEFSQLVEQCRTAKETLLAHNPPEAVTVSLLGSGSHLIGGARRAMLSREETEQLVLEGFFPLVEVSDRPSNRRSGVIEYGLPYVSDPSLTRHLAAFLNEHRRAVSVSTPMAGDTPIPDTILLNGGIVRSLKVVDRLIEQMTQWGGQEPNVLNNIHPDHAVAFGAVAYALARDSHALQRITSGAARSYFLVVDSESKEKKAVAILPRGTEEGHAVILMNQTFMLRLGATVRFDLVVAADDRSAVPGELLTIDSGGFTALPPLVAKLDYVDDLMEQEVRLVACLTETGTLDLRLNAISDLSRHWAIEFQCRQVVDDIYFLEHTAHPNQEEAQDLIRDVFGKKSRAMDPKRVKSLRMDLEHRLGPRASWPTDLLRALSVPLLEGISNRRRSEEHERLWLSLTGYCLRPGFGYPLDESRVNEVFSIFVQGIQFVNESQNWAEWWTLWRRLAGGLDQDRQMQLFEHIADHIDPSTSKRSSVLALSRKRSYEDMLRLSAVLERLAVEKKVMLGNWLLEKLAKPNEPMEAWWALGRIGGRIPFHASDHNVVDPETAERWLREVLKRNLRKETQPAFAATLMARMSGDRGRDISTSMRVEVLEQLRAAKVPDSWILMVTEYTELSEGDEKRLLGEALPTGLRLVPA